MKTRLDSYLAEHKYADSRSQAEHLIRLGYVTVNGKQVKKPGHSVNNTSAVRVSQQQQYVSRAALKLASIHRTLDINFHGKTVLDVGSSTGGFTDYALQHGAAKVIAVDVGSQQMHPRLRQDERVELHEKTDIRDFTTDQKIDVVLIDVSFISIRKIISSIQKNITRSTNVVAMVKPQFEAPSADMLNKGIVKNSRVRREILQSFERDIQSGFKIIGRADSRVSGAKGNEERFYLLRPIQ